ncbi:MAG: hypothetical protein NZL83_03030 [Candidatus Absconditabacterales bacterium]|nr:hypothetical protein [Candidatus Absconditabacterales bacterium]
MEGGEKKSINLDTIGGDQSYNQLYDNQKREERRNFPFTDVNSICAKKEGYKEENICLKPFTLLVHGIKDGNSMESMTQKVAMMQAEIFDPKKNINLMQDPNKICEKELISCSLIDENHMGTRSDCGFVLEANVDLIRNAGFSDLGTDFMGLGKTIKQEEEKYGLNYSPQEILDKTPPDSYNEIVLYGKKKEQTAKIQGIFIKVDERGYPIDWKKSKIDTDGQTRDIMTGKPPLSDQIYRLAYNMKLPVIFLYDKNHHLNQKNHSTHHSF